MARYFYIPTPMTTHDPDHMFSGVHREKEHRFLYIPSMGYRTDNPGARKTEKIWSEWGPDKVHVFVKNNGHQMVGGVYKQETRPKFREPKEDCPE